ncbi:putative aerolysin, Agglutinin domain, aerolysin-like toxin, beta complex domain-containing protein [Rosa chinensis]|uniref:Putative aerolysin, Agglutinin domain, aerolysin-like toxin, beta complex domain-containing protein n=1 Tax=Rosa chinensis TaxID=74649 RepID=A0A2P6SCT5_ROSCH|nr:uncharacterized protein LOC112164402 [Rosa chinensis]PRQ56490.1 putative aerolysin, Agglutinin domain, aerolysin-like toxin, beta complex domain-containing protein [Rosa chinensis]
MAGLPRFVVLKSLNHKCLCLTKNVPYEPAGFMKCIREQVVSPQAKFEVEMAKTGNGLVHIRCCYNNKYWVTNQAARDDTVWIVASADKPEEDQSKSSCTLFNPRFAEGQTQVRFIHVQLRISVSLWKSATTFENALYLGGRGDVFEVVDWESLVILPPRVAFKSLEDGSYLCSRWIERHPYQRFESNLDVGDPLVAKELFVTADGSLRIKDGHYGKFWRRSPNWIWADASSENTSDDTLFWPVKIQDNVIALRNLGNKNFCGGLTTEYKTNCLNAAYPNICKQSKLVVEELVLSRNIYNINFRLSDSRIYHEQVIEMDTALAVNDSPNRDSTISLKFAEKDSRTRSWNGSVSLKLGVKTTLEVKSVPLILDGKIELSAEVTTACQWGETTTVEHTREANYAVVVPPLSKMKVSLIASRASCDVPFSYSQRDILTDGRTVTKTMDDGLFTGINAYKFDYQNQASYDGQPLSVSSPWRLPRAVYFGICVILVFSVLLPWLHLV